MKHIPHTQSYKQAPRLCFFIFTDWNPTLFWDGERGGEWGWIFMLVCPCCFACLKKKQRDIFSYIQQMLSNLKNYNEIGTILCFSWTDPFQYWSHLNCCWPSIHIACWQQQLQSSWLGIKFSRISHVEIVWVYGRCSCNYYVGCVYNHSVHWQSSLDHHARNNTLLYNRAST